MDRRIQAVDDLRADARLRQHELDRAEGLATRTVTIAGGQIREDTAASGPIGVERAG